MVKKYADLFLDARRALLKQEGQFAANVARELVCAASGKTAEQIIADREIYASEEVCELTESAVLNSVETMTYSWYQQNVKPKPEAKGKGWVCSVCGYVYEGEELPEDFICPLCKHPASDFRKL